jgi:hypothetical protein
MGWVVNATPRPLYPLERHGTHCIGGWVGLRAGLDGCGKSRPPPGFDPRTVQPVASRYTVCPKTYRLAPRNLGLGKNHIRDFVWNSMQRKWSISWNLVIGGNVARSVIYSTGKVVSVNALKAGWIGDKVPLTLSLYITYSGPIHTPAALLPLVPTE